MPDYNIGAKIKELRRAIKLTLQDVANETGFSTALLSQIENNNISPPIATLDKIAHFFGVRIGHFFIESEEECPFEVLRCNERTVIPRVVSRDGSNHGYFYESLSVRKKNKRMDPFLLTLNEKVTNTDVYSHNGEEFLFVTKGTAELLLDDQRIVLNEGDSVYFDANLKHRLLSSACDEVKVMVVVMR
ncbi:helix-turn-helix domain-containing protein [Geotalea uraniireducens]|uniref:Transcriptional regulator, XRE family n=1 Tax=Geotalea uraniireducens (strain Rf4) TaxID=351605 RepID=A5G776_GEOUR|nr:XRE family transcriptional regulator [Geotalea uraniireducens]ABQ27644.1 transcriptional regulator, XRE family [Geotalea uraniireducens Rf4]